MAFPIHQRRKRSHRKSFPSRNASVAPAENPEKVGSSIASALSSRKWKARVVSCCLSIRSNQRTRSQKRHGTKTRPDLAFWILEFLSDASEGDHFSRYGTASAPAGQVAPLEV